MKDFIEHIIKQIATNPEEVFVEETKNEGYTNLRLKVSPDDMGLIIGKEGKTIRSIRSLVRAKAIKDNVKANLELIDPKTPNA